MLFFVSIKPQAMTSSGSCTKEMQGFWLRQEKREERKRWQYWVFSQPILLKLLDTQWGRFHQPSFTDEDTDDAWKGEWQPTPVFLLGEFYGQRSLVGYSPWGHKESGMTERLNTFTLRITNTTCVLCTHEFVSRHPFPFNRQVPLVSA